MHEVEPLVGLYKLPGHLVHLLVAGLTKCPVEQNVHPLPFSLETYPVEHEVHSESPSSSVNWPSGHRMHELTAVSI